MAPFEELPVELKETVFLDMPLRDINNVSKTCRSLRSVALPIMFRKLELTWDTEATKGPPITSLLRSMLDTPALGMNVKQLVLQAENYRGYQVSGFNGDILLPGHTHRIPAHDWEMFENALETCPCEEHGECDDPMTREGNLNAGIGILISRCTRLQVLQMDLGLLMHNYRFPAMLRSTLWRSIGPGGTQSWFEKLTQVTISRNEDNDWQKEKYAASMPVPTTTFLQLFYLPAVKTLEVTNFPDVVSSDHGGQKDGEHTIWPFPKSPVAHSLTTLRLWRSQAHPATLDALLQTTPNLTTLEYDLLIPGSKAPVCLDTLDQALQRVRPTLKHCCIRLDMFRDHDEYAAYEDLEPRYDDEGNIFALPPHDPTEPPPYTGNERNVCLGAVTSLPTFDALTTLDISLPVLYGIGRPIERTSLGALLPPNLQTFALRDDLWSFHNFLCDDVILMSLIRKFLAGQKLQSTRYSSTAFTHKAKWVAETAPQWKTCTPYLSHFTFDFEQGAAEGGVLLFREGEKEQLEQICEDQGIACEIRFQSTDQHLLRMMLDPFHNRRSASPSDSDAD